jgi:hypothetical protein
VVVGASKAALEAVTRYLGVELAPKNITVNAVSPGVVETEALKHFAIIRQTEVLARAAALTPAGRLVTPEDVAELVAFLCTPAARMIVGQTIMQDGGATLPFTGHGGVMAGQRPTHNGRGPGMAGATKTVAPASHNKCCTASAGTGWGCQSASRCQIGIVPANVAG